MPPTLTMRTPQEIVARLHASTSTFGFDREVLVPYLRFPEAAEFLHDTVTQAAWEDDSEIPLPPLTCESVLNEIREYLPHAIEKAIDHRGLSAGRTVEKLDSWTWLLGADVYDAIDWDNYAQYGAPIIKAVCEQLELTDLLPQDNEQFDRMARGETCRDGCDEGCGW